MTLVKYESTVKKIFCAPGLEELVLLKISILLVIYRFNAKYYQNLVVFSEIELPNLKFVWNHRTL